MKHNAKNERIKRRFARYLETAKRKNVATVDAALAAVERFEVYNKRRDFELFHIEQAIGFTKDLAEQRSARTGAPLTAVTRRQVLAALREFFVWLADQPGYRKRIRYSDADYFSLSLKEGAIASAERDCEGPTVEQVRAVIERMPHGTDIEKRDRALVAFALVGGMRVNAIASLRLKHVNVREQRIDQDPREVRTKAAKHITTFFFPVGDDLIRIVEEWIAFLREERQWGLDDPLFPSTRVGLGPSGKFEPLGLARQPWAGSARIRDVFRGAFGLVGLPYFNPHSLRKTLGRLGQERSTTIEQFKAWSQNLGHEKALTTIVSYGKLDSRRQGELVRALGENGTDEADIAALRRVLSLARQLPS